MTNSDSLRKFSDRILCIVPETSGISLSFAWYNNEDSLSCYVACYAFQNVTIPIFLLSTHKDNNKKINKMHEVNS